jgi:hypothetical protein
VVIAAVGPSPAIVVTGDQRSVGGALMREFLMECGYRRAFILWREGGATALVFRLRTIVKEYRGNKLILDCVGLCAGRFVS